MLRFFYGTDELIEVVSRLERDSLTLDESITLWERGERLAARCEEWLLGAKRLLDAARPSTGDA